MTHILNLVPQPRQIYHIELENDGSGLGFGIIGGRSTGTMVKTILPDGVAGKVLYATIYTIDFNASRFSLKKSGQIPWHVLLCVRTQDGRLRSGDLLLSIGNVDVSAMGSEEVAHELHVAGSHVRLIIAREITFSDPLPASAQQQDTQKKQVLVRVCAFVFV